MESSTSITFTRREKVVATGILLTCIFLSSLSLILIVAITQTFKLNGALQEIQEVARVITHKYGWLLTNEKDANVIASM